MIVIPMLGKSSRFFDAGYELPKYQLPLGNGTVFSESVKSFRAHFNDELFVFLIRSDFDARKFITSEVKVLGIKSFRLVEFSDETLGQADSVFKGTSDYSDDISIIVFNIDTIRRGFTIPSDGEFRDGFLEVFNGEGNAWSFVQKDDENNVIQTAEKRRISNLCSNGMYGFKRLGDFREAYLQRSEKDLETYGEIYIAPLYNQLIAKGFNIRCIELEEGVTMNCGTPEQYEKLKITLER